LCPLFAGAATRHIETAGPLQPAPGASARAGRHAGATFDPVPLGHATASDDTLRAAPTADALGIPFDQKAKPDRRSGLPDAAPEQHAARYSRERGHRNSPGSFLQGQSLPADHVARTADWRRGHSPPPAPGWDVPRPSLTTNSTVAIATFDRAGKARGSAPFEWRRAATESDLVPLTDGLGSVQAFVHIGAPDTSAVVTQFLGTRISDEERAAASVGRKRRRARCGTNCSSRVCSCGPRCPVHIYYIVASS
jgi:hypothetical protein